MNSTNNRTDTWETDVSLFFMIINRQIVSSRSLLHRINYKFMCLSAYWRQKLLNERERIFVVIVKLCISVIKKLNNLLSIKVRLSGFWNDSAESSRTPSTSATRGRLLVPPKRFLWLRWVKWWFPAQQWSESILNVYKLPHEKVHSSPCFYRVLE